MDRLAAVPLHFTVHGLDNLPTRTLFRCLLNRRVDEKRVRRFLVKDLNKSLGALDDWSGVLARTDVVAAAIVDHNTRLVGQNQLPDAVQHVLRDGASDRSI